MSSAPTTALDESKAAHAGRPQLVAGADNGNDANNANNGIRVAANQRDEQLLASRKTLIATRRGSPGNRMYMLKPAIGGRGRFVHEARLRALPQWARRLQRYEQRTSTRVREAHTARKDYALNGGLNRFMRPRVKQS